MQQDIFYSFRQAEEPLEGSYLLLFCVYNNEYMQRYHCINRNLNNHILTVTWATYLAKHLCTYIATAAVCRQIYVLLCLTSHG